MYLEMNSLDTSDVIIAKHRSHKSDQVAVQKMQVKFKVPPGCAAGLRERERRFRTSSRASCSSNWNVTGELFHTVADSALLSSKIKHHHHHLLSFIF